MLLHSFSMLVGMLAVVTFGCCAAEDRARTAGSAIHVDTVPYKADPSWQPSVPLPLEIGAMSSCAVGSNGDTFVGTRVKAAADLSPLLVLDKTGRYVRGFGNGTIKTVHGMRMQHIAARDVLWVTDSAASVVLQYDASTGKLLDTMGTKGTGVNPLQFGNVADVAFSTKTADVFISDGDGGINARVIKLNADMEVQWINGNNGTVAPGESFASPHSLDYDDVTSTVVVADRNNNRVVLLDGMKGTTIGTWTTELHFDDCTKPSIWSVRVDQGARLVYVATSSFGSGSACPNATKAARIVVVALPSTAMAATSASESNARNNVGTASTYASNPNVVGYAVVSDGGFPHELCADDHSGAVLAAAVDSADLPAADRGIRAVTRYIKA